MLALNNNLNSPSLADLTIKRENWIKKGTAFGFKACQCSNHDYKAREIIENQLMDYTKQISPEPEKRFSVLSIGSGDLLQDYLLLKKWISLGYKNLDITLVDPALKSTDHVQVLAKIIDKRNVKKGLSITLSSFNFAKECFEANPLKKYHLIYAIDFDRIDYEWSMFLDVKERLEDSGRLFLEKGRKITLAKNELFDLGREFPWLSHFVKTNNTAKKIHFGLNMPWIFHEENFTSVAALAAKGYYRIVLDLKKDEDTSDKTILKVKELCAGLSKCFSALSIEVNVVDTFEDEKYDLLSISSHQVITRSFLRAEKIADKMKQNGVLFLNFEECLSDYAMRKMGFGYYDYTAEVKEKVIRRSEIGESQRELLDLKLDYSKEIYISGLSSASRSTEKCLLRRNKVADDSQNYSNASKRDSFPLKSSLSIPCSEMFQSLPKPVPQYLQEIPSGFSTSPILPKEEVIKPPKHKEFRLSKCEREEVHERQLQAADRESRFLHIKTKPRVCNSPRNF